MSKTKKVPSKNTAPVKEEKKEVSKVSSLEVKKFKLPKIKVKLPANIKPIAKIFGMVLIIIASLAVVDLAVQYLNNGYSVAVVNGNRISKTEWHNRLEKAYGTAVATQLIEDQIIKAEAKKADVSVEKEAVDKEIDRIIESIGGEEMFDAALVANNITLEELRDQIQVDLLSTAILSPTLEYTEDNLKDFFNQYSDVIFPNESAALEEGAKLDFEQYKEETRDIYVQQEVQTKRTTWLTEKKAEYKIQDNSTGRPKYGFLTITTNLVNSLLESMKKDK